MRCRKCDYTLWNLRSRTCPECGLAFTPSDYDFVGNSVQYQCTECGQPYYGTDERGHLVPREFACVSCGAHQHMDDMILLPTQGVSEEQTQTDDMPWLDQRQGLKVWLKTGWRAAVSPGRLARTVPEQASTWQAWKFAGITVMIFVVGVAAPFFIMQTVMLAGAPIVAPWRQFGAFAGGMLGAWLLVLCGCVVWGAVTHGLLKLTGRTAGRIGRTYQGILYTSWVNVPVMIPICGSYALVVTLIWWPISAAVMIARLQQVGGVRVAIATSIVPILVAVAPVAIMFYGFRSAMTVTGAAFGSAQAEAQTVAQALNQHNALNGAYPAHAVGLLESAFVSPAEFVTMDSATALSDVPLGSVTLGDVEDLSPGEFKALAAERAQALPLNVVAHRVGDFVFTYHGVNPADPNLWTVIMWPEPGANTTQTYQEVVVGRTDGQVRVYYTPGFTSMLQAQNQLRAQSGLPPIPDPATITHDTPATGR